MDFLSTLIALLSLTVLVAALLNPLRTDETERASEQIPKPVQE